MKIDDTYTGYWKISGRKVEDVKNKIRCRGLQQLHKYGN